jgi:hypothetical protein
VLPVPRFHHIGVQTADLGNSLSWYQDFFGCGQSWSLDTFSELTHSRLPGIVRLVEMVVGDIRIHLFERPGRAAVPLGDSAIQFQHVCLAANSGDELVGWREHWLTLFASGKYTFAFAEEATGIVIDDDGIESFYAYDVNGLEFEFTYVPGDAP